MEGKREEGVGRKGRREEKEDRKNAKRESKSNIELELSNFRYYRNYRDFVNKRQINTAKRTHDHHTSSDRAPYRANIF